MKVRNILFFLIIIKYFSYSQDITIVRTDVDSSRASFVTATYNFSIKIKLNNVSNCTAVSFVLRHNQTNYVKFSNFRTFPFSRNGSVFVYPWYNPLDGFERIYTGILNGDTIGGKGENNPEVIEFEFTVSADAPSNSVLEFSFEDAEAVATEKNVGKIVKLKSQPLLLNIHGFVSVWPGDANNDGIVNINDVSIVALYLGYGPSKANFRSFQRLNPSTNWFQQLCLAWDSLATTYADCDGDGEITINDMLIIPLNFGKMHFVKNTIPNSEVNSDHFELTQVNEVNIPFIVVALEPIIGFVAEMPENSLLYSGKFHDETASNFSNNYCLVLNRNSKTLVTCGSTKFEPINEKVVYYSNQEKEIWGKGITQNGSIIPAKLVPKPSLFSSIRNDNENFVTNQIDLPAQICIYNILGQKVHSSFVNSQNELKNILGQQSCGAYLISIQTPSSIKTFKIY